MSGPAALFWGRPLSSVLSSSFGTYVRQKSCAVYSARPGMLRPLARAALTSGVLLASGDVVCQCIQRNQLSLTGHNWTRTARFAVIGLTLHGPFFHFGFRALDRRFGPATTTSNVLTKTVVGQVTLFPAFLCLFYLYMGALEGRSGPECIRKLKTAYVPSYVTGTLLWPAANIINFKYVPPHNRVAYVSTVGLLWQAFLSYVNSTTTS